MVDSIERTEILSLRMPASKAAAFRRLAAAQGREPAEHLEYLAIEALIAAGLLPQEEVVMHRLRESLIRRFVDKAEECYAETPRADIIAETARQLVCDVDWSRDHNEYKQHRDLRTLHPTLGRRVKLKLKLSTGKTYPVPKPNIFGHSSYLHSSEDGTPDA